MFLVDTNGEGELENAMLTFNAGDADILLCTTIVESGLDIAFFYCDFYGFY